MHRVFYAKKPRHVGLAFALCCLYDDCARLVSVAGYCAAPARSTPSRIRAASARRTLQRSSRRRHRGEGTLPGVPSGPRMALLLFVGSRCGAAAPLTGSCPEDLHREAVHHNVEHDARRQLIAGHDAASQRPPRVCKGFAGLGRCGGGYHARKYPAPREGESER
jgi:hypothetical protein